MISSELLNESVLIHQIHKIQTFVDPFHLDLHTLVSRFHTALG